MPLHTVEKKKKKDKEHAPLSVETALVLMMIV